MVKNYSFILLSPATIHAVPITLFPGTTVISRAILVLLILVCTASAPCAGKREDTLKEAMAAHLACYPLEPLDFQEQTPLIETKDLCLSAIYHETGGLPFWVTHLGPTERAAVIFDHLINSYREGLEPADYETELLQSLWDSKEPQALAQLDTLLTYNLVKYIHDMSFGQLKFRATDPELFAEAGDENFDPLAAIESALAVPDIGVYLDSLAPQHQYYENLRLALAYYRDVADEETWELIPSGPLIRPGMSDGRLEAIRKLLSVRGEILPDSDIPTLYDNSLLHGVKTFQRRYGLKPDGVIGPKTIAAMNIPVGDHITAIRVNLARWRWHEHDLGYSYIMVNIAGFSLKAVRHNQVVLDMPVIVGKSQHQTPVFSDLIKYLDFNPFWNITPSIARNEELPALRKDPEHLVKRNIRLFTSWKADAVELDSTLLDWSEVSPSEMSRYKLRQDPGPWNALGKVKFVFPNHYSIYLHDTSTQDLFKETSRSFSHGCIRVSRPLALALFCLENHDTGWTLDKIETIANLGERKILKLIPPLPIHITYQTVWVDNEGIIHFNSDIYGRDAKLIKVLHD